MKLISPARALALLILAAAPALFAQTPTPALLNYQGRVQTGTPPADFTGTGQFKFALVDQIPDPYIRATATVARASGVQSLAGATFTVTNGGTGYATAPAVTVSAPNVAGGVQATVIATVSGGSVTGFTVGTAGSGYTSNPALTIAHPPARTPTIIWNNNGPAPANPVNDVSLPVTNGLYSALLGDNSITNMAAIPPEALARPDVRLRVWFNGTQLAPDQRLAANGFLPSKIGTNMILSGAVHMADKDLFLRNYQGDFTEKNHGIGWYGGAGRSFDATTVDGPVLYGYSGGALGSRRGTTETIALRWDANGRIGIGTVNPTSGVVHIATTAGSDIGAHKFLAIDALGGVNNGTAGPQAETSLYAAGEIHASVFRAFSDERIKNIAGPSDGAQDLAALLGIQITDYTYRDTVTRGSTPQKKVIAQQVEKVFPQAVRRSTDVVPDIYKKATAKDGWVNLSTDLKPGERVRLCTDKAEEVYEVLEVRDGAFRTAFTAAGDLFVYGREVQDFRTVDYEAIAMLNVSATQQLKKESDAALATLRDENTALRTRLEALETAAAKRDAQLAALTRLLERSTGDTVTVSTAALTK